MDACLDLFISQLTPNAGLRRETKSFTWNGIKYPQDPQIYDWRGQVRLRHTDAPAHLLTRIPEDLASQGLMHFSIENSALNELERLVNELHQSQEESALEEFLKDQLVSNIPWVLIFEPQCDQIDIIFEADRIAALKQLRSSLDWTTQPKGFIAFHRPPRD